MRKPIARNLYALEVHFTARIINAQANCVLKPISQQWRNDLLSFGFDKQIKVAEIPTNFGSFPPTCRQRYKVYASGSSDRKMDAMQII